MIQPFYRKELATGNTTSGNYKLLIILNHINLTHWDFADKDISTMRFPNCLYYNKEENILEEIQKAIDAKIKGEK